MADETPNETEETVEGTSAGAEVPDESENVTEPSEAEEVVAEDTSADAEVPEETPDADAPIEAEVEADAAASGTSSEADVPAEEPADAEEPVEAEAEASGTSAEAEVPKKKKKRLPRALRPKKTRPTRARSAERKPIVRLEKPEHDRGRRQERQGKVVSDAMEKTIVVEVAVVKAHPRYKKVVRRSVKFHAHDERSEAKVGDLVRIVETRPLSRTKRWRLVEVVEAAK
jgi:small subunit ribosomal protein S17